MGIEDLIQKASKVTKGILGDTLIQDKSGEKIGKIDKSLLGETIIQDKAGNKVGIITKDWLGRITKNFWGETVIDRS